MKGLSWVRPGVIPRPVGTPPTREPKSKRRPRNMLCFRSCESARIFRVTKGCEAAELLPTPHSRLLPPFSTPPRHRLVAMQVARLCLSGMLGSAGAAAGETRVSMLLLVITCSEPRYPNGRLGPLPMDTRAVGLAPARGRAGQPSTSCSCSGTCTGFTGKREK